MKLKRAITACVMLAALSGCAGHPLLSAVGVGLGGLAVGAAVANYNNKEKLKDNDRDDEREHHNAHHDNDKHNGHHHR